MSLQKPIIKVGIVAGEYSGDRLGAKIISGLKKTHHVELYGVGGPKIIQEGLSSIFDFSKLHVMGLIEPLIKYRQLRQLQKKLINLFIENDIDYFIGIDSPDFNISIHKILKQKDISKNIQVVSPSVWGWREGRIKNIKRYIDLTMCLFKFECNFYDQKNMQSFFLGHPFSQLKPGKIHEAISKYGLDSSNSFISILPGSRESEISQLMPVYVEAAKKLSEMNPNAFFLVPAANKKLAEMIESTKGMKDIPHIIAVDAAQDFLTLSPISIVTSGTASLEASVLGSVPIICYKTNFFNYAILSRLVKTPFVGLPNLLLQAHVFPELIQNDLTPDSIVNSFLKISSDPTQYQMHLSNMNESMQGEGFEAAAEAINNLL